ncbi:hypothetical protein [Chengkuizengella marina]|uniref:hypothetical protein n=1 Tax=Chengkuizengella marina TaxID=2507566 RepID=UPI00136D780E|nr:hypothetical protein [Chengkuizengella marina]
MKKSIFWVGIAICILSFIGNYLFFQSEQLKEPIFLDHYYDFENYNNNDIDLTFYYLTNKNDTFKIKNALINGVEVYPVSYGGFSMLPNNTQQYEQEFTHHYLKSVTFSIPYSSISSFESLEEVWSIENMIVSFYDHKDINAEIGKINIYTKPSTDKIFDFQVSGSSNQHREYKIMTALQSLNISNISVPFEELIDEVEIKVNLNQEKLKQLKVLKYGGDSPAWFDDERKKDWNELEGVSTKEQLFPLKIRAGDWMQLQMAFNPNHKSYFQFGIRIEGVTENGEPFVERVLINDYPHLSQKNINEIIEAKQGVVSE